MTALIFVSCGQVTDTEKSLGVAVKATIDATPGFEAYFAETVHDLQALGVNVFDALRRCAGAVMLFQDRGKVVRADGTELGHRSSVWVNQELAILAYRQFVEATSIPLLAFVDPNVRLEGAMTSLIVNPHRLGPAAEVASVVRAWLRETAFGSAPDHVFRDKWSQLSDSARRVIAGLIEEGGELVKESAVRRALMRRFNFDGNRAAAALSDAKLQFINTGLVDLIQNIHSGDELSIHGTWKFALQREIARWLANGR